MGDLVGRSHSAQISPDFTSHPLLSDLVEEKKKICGELGSMALIPYVRSSSQIFLD
jgi:hypothetical protein